MDELLVRLVDMDAVSVLTLGVLALAATIFTVAWMGLRVLSQYMGIIQDQRKTELQIKADTANALQVLSQHDREQLEIDKQQLEVARQAATAINKVDKTTTDTLLGVERVQKTLSDTHAKIDALPDRFKVEVQPLMIELKNIAQTVETFQSTSQANVNLLTASQERQTRELTALLNSISSHVDTLISSMKDKE